VATGPLGSAFAGNHWVPVMDFPNDWVQLGNDVLSSAGGDAQVGLCWSHNGPLLPGLNRTAGLGAPSWGASDTASTNPDASGKGHVFCCRGPVSSELKMLGVASSHMTDIDCPIPGTFCIKEGSRWLLVLYLMGVIYMFVALAIVCDEFFVPSLEVFVEEFDVSMDVAGATFMAAGGSMPELFTACIGTFSEPPSDVGFATIVGSAVFNVLFVIGVCAVSSKEVLVLTWWPLCRDCTCYIVSLATLVLFFQFGGDSEIRWPEAMFLLFEYFLYCTLMKYNDKVYTFLDRWFGSGANKVLPSEEGDHASSDPTHSQASGSTDGRRSFCLTMSNLDGVVDTVPLFTGGFTKPSTFRAGIMELLTQGEDIVETAGIAVVAGIVGDVRQTFDEIDKDNSGYIDSEELKELLSRMGCKPDSRHIASALKSINRKGDGAISFDEFSRWYVCSEARIEIKMRRVFDRFDSNGNNTIEREELTAILTSLGHHVSDADIDEALKEILHFQEDPSTPSDQQGLNRYPPVTAVPPAATNETAPSVGQASTFPVSPPPSPTTPASPPLLSPAPPPVRLAHPPVTTSTPLPNGTVEVGSEDSEASISFVDEGFAPVVPAKCTVSSRKTTDLQADVIEESPPDPARRPSIHITFEMFDKWYSKSLFWSEEQKAHLREEKVAEQFFNIDPPDNNNPRALFWYIVTYPICVALYTTLPDVRKDRIGRPPVLQVAIFQFVVSLFWIAAFAMCMVNWATIASNTVGIPTAVAGVTVIAAGTSIPDLLSSYIVAQKGEGDMAVSSSIGSNIFDILVGLPLPWLIFGLLKGKAVKVTVTSPGFSILLLMAMLVAVLGTVKLMRWRMTKTMGYTMFLLYGAYMIQDLLRQLPEGNPHLKIDF